MKVVSDIEKSFGQAATTYDGSADVQRQAAKLLGRRLGDLLAHLPAGPVLELACGTGLFSEELVALCHERDLTISDLSPEMVRVCQSRLHAAATFTVLDAESLALLNKHALITCAFGAQWFQNLRIALDGIMAALVPGGYFLFSLPTDASFPEWKTACARLGTEFTGNKLPTAGMINNYCLQNGYASDLHATQIRASYASSLAFFQALANLGATARVPVVDRSGLDSERGHQPAVSVASLRPLIRQWDGEAGSSVTVTYDVLYGFLKRY